MARYFMKLNLHHYTDATKRKLHDYRKAEINECIEYIEELIKEGCSIDEVKKGVEIKLGSRYGTIRNIFSDLCPYPINTYIKRRYLTVVYLDFIKNPCHINTRSEYRGIPHIMEVFRRCFDLEFIELHTEEELQPKLDIDTVWEIHHMLNKAPYVDEYNIESGTVKLKMNYEIMTAIWLQHTTYCCPLKVWEVCSPQLEEGGKALFCEIILKYYNTNNVKIILPNDDIERVMTFEELYDFDDPLRIGDWLFFTPEMPYYCKESFGNIADLIIPQIKRGIPQIAISKENYRILEAISKANSFIEVADELKCNETEAKGIVWDYLADGLLRFYPEKDV